MKILIVCQYYYPENFAITNIAEGFVKRGHDVTVLTGKPNYGYGYILPNYQNISFEQINKVKVHRVDVVARRKNKLSLIKNYLSFWKNSKKWVKRTKERFDLVYSFSLSPVLILSAGNLYKKRFKIPHYAHIVDIWPESVVATKYTRRYSPLYFLLYFWSRNIYKKVDKLLLGSPSYRDYFNNVLKLKKVPMEYVPQPCLTEEYHANPYHFKHKFNIVYCGNVNKLQMIHMIPLAMQKVNNKDICFHIIGSGAYASDLVKDIDELGVNDSVVLHGPVPADEAVGYFETADAAFVALNTKGYVGKTIPNKLIVSMAYKKPIIAMLNGDGKDVLLECDGAIFADQNVDDLVFAITKMASLSDEARKKLGDNNYSYYSKRFTLKNIIDKLELVFVSRYR